MSIEKKNLLFIKINELINKIKNEMIWIINILLSINRKKESIIT